MQRRRQRGGRGIFRDDSVRVLWIQGFDLRGNEFLWRIGAVGGGGWRRGGSSRR